MKYSKLLILALTCSLGSAFGQVQVGPGGVGSAADLKVWIDASQLSFANGAIITSAADASGNGHNFFQSNGSRKPTFVSSSVMNSRPALNFDGVDDFLQSSAISEMNTQNLTWYTAFNTASATSGERVAFSSRHISPNGSGLQLFINTRYSTVNGMEVISYKTASPNLTRLSTPYASGTQVIGGVRSSTSFKGLKNGSVFASYTGGMYNPNATHQYCRIGANTASANQYFQGVIGEVIAYTKTLNETQNIILSNYLSSKYGKAMAANDKYSFESTHGEEVAGIGRVASGDEHLSARGTDIVQITSAGLDDGDFLLWANDGADLVGSNVNVPTDYTISVPLGSRFERSWKVAETGETGNLTIRFDLSTYGFSPTSDYELLIDIDNDNDFSNAVRHTGVFSGSFVTFNILGTDLSNGNLFTLGNPVEPIESIVDGQNWNDPTTWNCSCVPDEFDDVNILASHSVTVSDEQAVSSLTIDLGGELVISSTGVFNVNEALDIRGNTDFDINSVVRFTGPLEQNVFCSTSCDFGKLTMDNVNGVTFSAGDYSVRGLYRPDAGVVDITGSVLTFASSATQTSRIGVWGATSNLIGGTVRVQRYVAAGDANNRNLTTPFASGFSLRDWNDDVKISGTGFPNGCAYSSGACYFSARTWVPSTGSYAPITDIDAVFAAGTGIEIYLGDNLNTLSAKTLTSRGTISNSASVSLNIQSQWNLIGNPMMCPIDFNDVTRGSGIGNYYYVLNPNTNAFEWYDGSNNTSSVVSLADGKIASHQGFWVFKSSGGSTTMTFDQGSKDTVITDNFMKSNINDLPSEFFKIQLSSLDRKYLATTVIKRGDKFLAEMDENDLPKFPFEQENVISLYTKTKDGNDVVVNSIGSDDDCMIIPLYFDAPIDGEYTLSLANIPFEYEVDLYDRVEKTFVKLNLTDDAVTFDQEIAEGAHRFDIRITKSATCAPITIEEATSVLVYATNADIIVEIEENERSLVMQVIGLSGQIIAQYSNVNSDYFRVNSNLETGIYLVNLVDPITKSVVKSEKVFINR